MKNTLKRLTALVLSLAMLLTLAACGGKAEETPKAAEASASGEEPVTIRIAWWGGDTRHALTKQVLDKYTELHPNVTFQTSPSGWDGYFEKLATETASGNMPDLVQMDYLYISTYAQNNSVADLTPYIDNGTIDVSGVDENLLNSAKINGKLAGLVVSSSLLAMTYNPEVLEQAGVAAPTADWTWADFTAMGKSIAATAGLGISTGIVDDTNIFNYWLRQNGEKLYADDNQSLGYADDKVCADFFTMWKDMMDAGVAADPDEYAQISTLGVEADPVVTGGAGFTLRWNNYSNQASATNDGLKMMTPPLTNDGAASGLWLKPGMFFSIAETSKVKDEAAAFLNWFLNSEEANDIMMGERGTPASKYARDYLIGSNKLTPCQQDMFAYVTDAAGLCGVTPAPDPSGTSEITDAFKNAAYSVFYGQATAEEAAADFRTQANEILERNNG